MVEYRIPVLDKGVADNVQVLRGVNICATDTSNAEATGEGAEVEVEGVDGVGLAAKGDGWDRLGVAGVGWDSLVCA